MKKQLQADGALLLVTLFWGTSYVLMKMGMENISEFNLIALRFDIAFILSSLIFIKKILKIDFRILKISALLGFLLFFVFAFVTFGLKRTSASNAGFLIGITVVIVPLLQGLILKEMPKKNAIVGVCFALIGIYFLTVKENLSINFGDLLCIIAAFICAFHIIVVEKYTHSVDSVLLGILQVGFVGLFSTIFSFIIEVPHLPQTKESWIIILILSIFCTALSYIVQTAAQQYTSPTHTGLIFSLESLFSAIFAYFFAGEILSGRGYFGATLLLIGIFIAEIDFTKIILKLKNF